MSNKTWSSTIFNDVMSAVGTNILTTSNLTYSDIDTVKNNIKCTGKYSCNDCGVCSLDVWSTDPTTQCTNSQGNWVNCTDKSLITLSNGQMLQFNDGSEDQDTHTDSDDDDCCIFSPYGGCAGYKCRIVHNSKYTLTQGVPDGETTCQVGNNKSPYITCASGCNISSGTTDWLIADYPTNTQYNAGSVNCAFNYDFSTYNYSTISTHSSWILNMVQDTNGFPYSQIRDRNVMYGLIFDFYNQIYNQAPYNQNLPPELLTLDIFSDQLNSKLNSYIGIYNPCYPDITNFNNINTALISNYLIMPYPLYDSVNSKYYIRYSVSLSVVKNYTSTDLDQMSNDFLQNLYRDEKGLANDQSTNSQWNLKKPTFKNTKEATQYNSIFNNKQDIQSYTYIDFTSTNYNAFYSDSLVINNPQNYLFATFNFVCEIETWSPVLAILFQIAEIDLLPIYKTIQNDCSDPIHRTPFSIPLSVWNTCSLPNAPTTCEQISNLLNKDCPITYNPPPYLDRTYADRYFLTGNAKPCYCLNSTLMPNSERTFANKAALCFDKNCNENIRSQFDLTDANCSQYCTTVWSWLNASGEDQGSSVNLDQLRYEQICGKNFDPYTPNSYNKNIIIFGSITCLISSGFVYINCIKKGFSISSTIIFSVLTFIIFGLITGFLSRDLAAKGMCESKNNFVCKSRITNLTLPKTFCNYYLKCECNFDNDCPQGCDCITESCIPSNNTRKVVEKKENYIDIPSVVSITICTLLSIGIFYNANIIYKWNINKYLLILLIVSLGIALIFFISRKSRTDTDFVGICCPGTCGPVNNCGLDGCSDNSYCNSGKCPDGMVCCNNMCAYSCVNNIPIYNFSFNCPLTNSLQVNQITTIPNSLQDKVSYYIYFQYNTITYYLISSIINFSPTNNSGTLYLYSNTTPVLWNYNNNMIYFSGDTYPYSQNTYIIAQDISNQTVNSTCGNVIINEVQNLNYLGAPSLLYTNNSDILSYSSRFIISNNTIFSIDANCYIIPDTNNYPYNIPPGYTLGQLTPRGMINNNMISLTYTTDSSLASVWTISTNS